MQRILSSLINHFAYSLDLLEETAIISGFQHEVWLDHRIYWRSQRTKTFQHDEIIFDGNIMHHNGHIDIAVIMGLSDNI